VWRKELDLEKKNTATFNYVYSTLSLHKCVDDTKYTKAIDTFNSKLAKMWKDCNRTLQVFEKRHNWLDQNIKFFSVENNSTKSEGTVVKKGSTK
jgi:IS1 family transposase